MNIFAAMLCSSLFTDLKLSLIVAGNSNVLLSESVLLHESVMEYMQFLQTDESKEKYIAVYSHSENAANTSSRLVK